MAFHNPTVLDGLLVLSLLAWTAVVVWSARHLERGWLGGVLLVLGLLALLGGAAFLVADRYTGVGINEAALFQVQFGGAGLTARMWAPLFGLGAGVFLVLGAWVAAMIRSVRRPRRGQRTADDVGTAGEDLGAVGRRWTWWRRPTTAVVLALLAVASSPGLVQIATIAVPVWRSLHAGRTVLDGLVAPDLTTPPARPISVVWIYVESFEGTFRDGRKFPGLVPAFNKEAQSALQFDQIGQAPFTGWTIAGQMASQCGFPSLEARTLLHSDPIKHPCIGDILGRAGYTRVYLNGASMSFVSQGAFWTHHGFSAHGTNDVRDLAGSPNAPLSSWGAYDDTLFQAGLNTYHRLRAAGAPFELVLMTMDTHEPHGFPTPACADEQASAPPLWRAHRNLEAVHCLDRTLVGFVRALRRDLPDNVLVVVQNDHLMPGPGDDAELLGALPDRRDQLLVWGRRITPRTDHRSATMFDVAPTVLHLLGYTPKGLGFGRDLLDPTTRTLVEAQGWPWVNKQMDTLFLAYAAGRYLQNQAFAETHGTVKRTTVDPNDPRGGRPVQSFDYP